MSVFLTLTFELDCADTRTQNKRLGKILDYIIDNLNDIYWQDFVSKRIRKNVVGQIETGIALRFFRQARVEENKLKSYARYLKKDEYLVIDPIFILEEYMNLNEDELRKKICNDLFCHLETVLVKYKEHFKDLDVAAFIPLLKDRVEEIKSEKFLYSENNELEDLLDGILDENLNYIDDDE